MSEATLAGGVDAHAAAPHLPLDQSREDFRRALAANLADSLIGWWWFGADRLLRRLSGRGREVPFALVVAGVCLLVLVASYTLSLLIGETTLARPAHFTSRVMWAGFTLLYILVMNAQLEHAVKVVSTTITQHITSPRDLGDLQELIRKAMRKPWQLTFSLIFALVAGAWIPSMLSYYGDAPLLTGAIMLHVINYFQIGMYIYFLLVVIWVLVGLSRLELDIYANDPSNSPVIRRIFQVCSALTLASAALGAIQYFLMTVSRIDLSTPFALMALFVLGFVPPLALFIAIHLSLARIMTKTKGRKLAQLQTTIGQIEKTSDATSKDQLEVLQLLMDYHDRIKATPNSMVNYGSLANLFASLLLPLIATILGNIPVLLELFRSSPAS